MNEEVEDRGDELTRAGLALVRACYTDEGSDELYADLVASYSLQEREEAWSLAAGLLLRYLADHGERAGCNCGDAVWFERVMSGEVDHD